MNLPMSRLPLEPDQRLEFGIYLHMKDLLASYLSAREAANAS
jgi:hypothetical protein